ncbi:aspartyl/asparaginyl beta-hydroxylase domain-containing protein [Pseudomonas sp. R3.Fl]|uniref:aspartyl/asparaginyl beta-hydroxylase domain-containing protein n=1 Tax=Pseudomonas TaxID=286 RepID=UPI00201E25F2|nr:aspartyl/asparaginyl beta-hydroxylase domain-containing protein [Pseudomonas sp. R3.Fl]MCL6693347.1 aspartyl/asparaginyl beta-hydroxylase domain-containing protein [Pseudomonas sp. R3.Fl]
MPDKPRPSCSRLPIAIDLPPLLAALDRVEPGAWQHHFNSGYYEGDWSGVALISAVDAPLPLAPGHGAPRASDWWQQEAAWHQLLGVFHSSVRSARLLRLGPGARIHEHCDPDLGMPGGDLRLHVPLRSAEAVEFLLDGLQVPMRPGECWFLDLSRPHRVDNPSTQARIHLVLDCAPEPWLLALVEQGLEGTPELLPGRAVRAFLEFRRRVEQDAALARRLRECVDAQAFIREAIRQGEAAGLCFAEAEVRAAMRQGRQAWSEQWTVR